MKKLRLNVDELRVESFESDARGAAPGTVRAYSGGDCSYRTVCDIETCGGGEACWTWACDDQDPI